MKGSYPDAKSAQGGGGTRTTRMDKISGGPPMPKGVMGGGDTCKHKGTMGDGRGSPKAKGTIIGG